MEFKEFLQAVKKAHLEQYPPIVKEDEKGRLFLVSGSTRVDAHKERGNFVSHAVSRGSGTR